MSTEIARLTRESYPGFALYRARCLACPDHYERYDVSDDDAKTFIRGAMRAHIAQTGHEVVITREDP